MSYTEHYENILTRFQDLDLLKESEFDTFKNSEFAEEIIKTCIQLCENASGKLKIPLHFAVIYNHTFNATAKIKNDSATIIFNLGLIDKLESIISDSMNLFMAENIASMTIQNEEKNILERILIKCCISYLFHHELAHIIQLLNINSDKEFNLQEKYSNTENFEVRNHIYELDADHFGSAMSAYNLLDEIMNSSNQFETVKLFNALTSLLFTTSNIIIEFSGNNFQNIYYKENSHPHPLIRIIECSEQVLSFISSNLNIPKQFFEATLQRTVTMISQIIYSDGRKIDYSKLYSENSKEMSNYIDEIDKLNENYAELTRHKSQQIFNVLTK
ncbi:hypothetical protein [Flavobacterium sp. H122]|uniref:hypothetical protein n=1 Tax=Flavobacterium sp. H122 TaxID=2529860 RepID=UPI0010AA7568|nr:hypothetical protein [Flavobacterium sp. H122]